MRAELNIFKWDEGIIIKYVDYESGQPAGERRYTHQELENAEGLSPLWLCQKLLKHFDNAVRNSKEPVDKK